MPKCVICHKEFTTDGMVTEYCDDGLRYIVNYNGKEIEYDNESVWVCNKCLDEE